MAGIRAGAKKVRMLRLKRLRTGCPKKVGFSLKENQTSPIEVLSGRFGKAWSGNRGAREVFPQTRSRKIGSNSKGLFKLNTWKCSDDSCWTIPNNSSFEVILELPAD